MAMRVLIPVASLVCHVFRFLLMLYILNVVQISEEEGRLKKDEEETKEMWKRKREHEEQWEGTREKRVSFQLHYVVFCFEIYYF